MVSQQTLDVEPMLYIKSTFGQHLVFAGLNLILCDPSIYCIYMMDDQLAAFLNS